MKIKTRVTALLDRKMSRQEFLSQLAFGVAAMSGAGLILRMSPQKTQVSSVTSGQAYGSSVYGGIRPGSKDA